MHWSFELVWHVCYCVWSIRDHMDGGVHGHLRYLTCAVQHLMCLLSLLPPLLSPLCTANTPIRPLCFHLLCLTQTFSLNHAKHPWSSSTLKLYTDFYGTGQWTLIFYSSKRSVGVFINVFICLRPSCTLLMCTKYVNSVCYGIFFSCGSF